MRSVPMTFFENLKAKKTVSLSEYTHSVSLVTRGWFLTKSQLMFLFLTFMFQFCLKSDTNRIFSCVLCVLYAHKAQKVKLLSTYKGLI